MSTFSFVSATPSPWVVFVLAARSDTATLCALLAGLPPGADFTLVIVAVGGHTAELQGALAPHTVRPVVVPGDGQELRRGDVYLISQDRRVVVHRARMRCTQQRHRERAQNAADVFAPARALYEPRTANLRALCVVLAGAAAEAALDMRDVSNRFERMFVQSGWYASLRANPLTGTCAELFPMETIATRLLELVHATAAGQSGPETAAASEQVLGVLQAVRAHTGSDFHRYKRRLIVRQIERRMELQCVRELAHYERLVRESRAEAEALVCDFLIGATSFFRDREVFDVLRESVEQLIVGARSGQGPIRVWSCGCGAGQEAYSLAMIFNESMLRLGKRLDVRIIASDRNARAIGIARAGIYPAEIAPQIPPDLLRSYFAREGDDYRAGKQLRDMLLFSEHDVLADPPYSRLDLISCRNLLVYLDDPAQEELHRVFHWALKPRGLLLLGPAEFIDEANGLYEPLDARAGLFRRKDLLVSSPRLAVPKRAAASPPTEAPGPRAQSARTAGVAARAEEALLRALVPSSVIVDRRGDILHVHGRVGAFLELVAGPPSMNVLQMAHEDLRDALVSAFYAAQLHGKAVRRLVARDRFVAGARQVELEIVPIRDAGIEPATLVIAFREREIPHSEPLAGDEDDGLQLGTHAAHDLPAANEE